MIKVMASRENHFWQVVLHFEMKKVLFICKTYDLNAHIDDSVMFLEIKTLHHYSYIYGEL